MKQGARPRLLQICAVDFTAYHFMLPLMRAQRKWGFEVELACTPGAFRKSIEAEGFPLRPLPISRSRNVIAHLRAYRELGKILREREYTVVHVHTPVAALIGRPAARRAGVPVVLYTAHGFYFHDAMAAHTRRAHIMLERRAQRSADFLFTQSAEDAATAVAERISGADRTLAIGNGVDLSRFQPGLLGDEERRSLRAELGIKNEEGPIVVMMGRLVREKGYFEFLEAWADVIREFPRARAILIGEALPSDHDDSAALIHTAIARLGIGASLVLTGLRRDVPRLLALGDLFVLPSWREGMPRSIIEAMGAGLPVIATDIRGCREEVVDGETGLIVPARDPAMLAAALRRLMADSELRTKMGAAGLRRAQENFSEDAVIARQEAVYRKIFREKGLAWPGSA